MPYLLITHSRHPLAAGRHLLVLQEDGAIRIDPLPEAGSERAGAARGRDPGSTDGASADVAPGRRIGVFDVTEDGRAAIRRIAPHADVEVDGVPISTSPVALAHGAKLTVHGARIIFGDEQAGGGTERRAGVTDEQLQVLEESLPAEPTSDVGGALVAAGGRRYAIPAEGLEIGRDPNCDVVLSSKDASRWHASIAPSVLGYVIRDTSANGVLVNGRRIDEQRVLGRGDVIRIGDDEFTFEAAPARYEPSTSLRLAAVQEAEGVRDAAPAPGPQTEPQAARPPLLATLEVISSGVLQGRRFRIEHPLSHIGRAPHNEVRLADESISGSHATLQRRGGGWVVVDQESRNGTYVDGDRVEGERALRGACEIRFGGVRTVFRPLAGSGEEPDATRGIVGIVLGGE